MCIRDRHYADLIGVDGPAEWIETSPVEGWITTLAAADPDVVYAGTATLGVFMTWDAGQVWAPAREGLGLAAGQMVNVTALSVDRQEPGVLYATVDHAVGSTEVHSSAAGAYVSVDSGATWQPLAGPAFPDARHAADLVTVPAVSYTHLRAHETVLDLVCRLLLEKKNKKQ
mgnify:CR=1 FL=1